MFVHKYPKIIEKKFHFILSEVLTIALRSHAKVAVCLLPKLNNLFLRVLHYLKNLALRSNT